MSLEVANAMEKEERVVENGGKCSDNENETFETKVNGKCHFDFDGTVTDNKTMDIEMRFEEDGECDDNYDANDCESEFSRIQELEEEHESLLSSLMALTTHFAQVQFRLHQIVEAPEKERDDLLKKLEDFADRGIPQANEFETRSIFSKMDCQKLRQQELIEQLKTQLDDLEKYAYETGEPVLPQAIMMERQKIIIDELKQKMNLNFNELELPQLSPDELRNQVDAAIGEFVSPLKMKEQLVAQLKTQVNDLERFIKFLQVEKGGKKMLKQQFLKRQNCSDIDLHNQACNCNFKESTSAVATVANGNRSSSDDRKVISTPTSATTTTTTASSTAFSPHNGIGNKVFQMLNKASTIFHIFAFSQLDCASQNGRHFRRNVLKKTTRGNHWGDTRAKLEVDIQEILALMKVINKAVEKENQLREVNDTEAETEDDEVFSETSKTKMTTSVAAVAARRQSRYRSNSSCSSSVMLQQAYNNHATTSKSDYLKTLNIELITLVRKKFAVTLQKLIQHGLRSVNETRHLVPFIGCFYTNFNHQPREYPEEDVKDMHAWELILEYYRLKNGDFYTETPAQKLSQSFNLEIVGDGLTSNKQTLLLAIRNIINLHSPYKRSYNSHFKAFVCAGLNSRKLVQWLNSIFQCHELVSTFYTSWSYVAQTGFRDALKAIDQLSRFEYFDLPVDLAIRNLANIKDVFS